MYPLNIPPLLRSRVDSNSYLKRKAEAAPGGQDPKALTLEGDGI
jgi:hypothetical protein